MIALASGLGALLVVASAQTASEAAPATVEIRSTNFVGAGSLSERQYQEMLSCSVANNAAAVAAWIDTRFELGQGLAAKFAEETGKAAGLQTALDGCVELKTGSLPFSLDRLSRDWADHFGISKDDPNTLDQTLGIKRVGNFEELADCIRERNSSEVIRSFLAMPSGSSEKAQALVRMMDKCAAAPGANLRVDYEALEQTLGHEKVG